MRRSLPLVRPARDEELEPVAAVLRAAGLGASVGRLLQFPRASPGGEVLVAVADDRIIGGAAVAGFGSSGWIGALGVHASARRRGVGSALTEAAVAWLREHGSATALLYATNAGRPVYARLGFVDEGDASAWRDLAPPRPAAPVDGVRLLRPADGDAVRALDVAATGEDRRAVLDELVAGGASGLVVERYGRVAGSALRSPWGLGPSVVADDAAAGLALLSALRREPGPPLTISLPDANADATRTLRAWGLQAVNRASRMRLGPAVPYVPGRVFGLFNLFWG